jgi:lysophospholipase L1-like esterase
MAMPLAPLLWWQGRRVRRVTPVLTEAAGPRTGRFELATASGGEPLRLLLLGDSSAAGVGAAHQHEALSGQLAGHLKVRQGADLPALIDWTLQARTGLRTREATSLLQGAPSSPPARFDLAVVALGVNDVTALQRPARWLADVDQVVSRLHREHGVRCVLWSGLPPMHRFPALPQPLRAVMGRHARDLDAALRMHAGRSSGRLRHVPMPPMSRAEWIARDGFHPAPEAYAVWGGVLAQAIVEALIASQRPASSR